MTLNELVATYISENGSMSMSDYGHLVVTYEAVKSISKAGLSRFQEALKNYQYELFVGIEEQAASQGISRTSKVIEREKTSAKSKVEAASGKARDIYHELMSGTPRLSEAPYEDSDSAVTQFAALLKKQRLTDSDVAQLDKIWNALKRSHTKDNMSKKVDAVKRAAKDAATKGASRASSMIGKLADKITPSASN